MNATLYPVNADTIEYRLTVTMTLSDWKKLSAQITAGTGPRWEYPASKLQEHISDMVRQAERNFSAHGG